MPLCEASLGLSNRNVRPRLHPPPTAPAWADQAAGILPRRMGSAHVRHAGLCGYLRDNRDWLIDWLYAR
jgi:hypothetical protein